MTVQPDFAPTPQHNSQTTGKPSSVFHRAYHALDSSNLVGNSAARSNKGNNTRIAHQTKVWPLLL